MKVCPTPGHPWLVGPGQPCPEGCGRSKRTRKRTAEEQVYGNAAWRRTRQRFIRSHPMCVRCSAQTEDVDHVVPRRILLAAGVVNPDAPSWLQPLCHAHHSSKTATVDRPLLARLDAGEDPSALAEEALSKGSRLLAEECPALAG